MIRKIKSNRLKKDACDRCVDRLRGILSDEQLHIFESAFYAATDGIVFSERR